MNNVSRVHGTLYERLKGNNIMRIYTAKSDEKFSTRKMPAHKFLPPAHRQKSNPLICGRWFNANTLGHHLTIKKLRYDKHVFHFIA